MQHGSDPISVSGVAGRYSYLYAKEWGVRTDTLSPLNRDLLGFFLTLLPGEGEDTPGAGPGWCLSPGTAARCA